MLANMLTPCVQQAVALMAFGIKGSKMGEAISRSGFPSHVGLRGLVALPSLRICVPFTLYDLPLYTCGPKASRRGNVLAVEMDCDTNLVRVFARTSEVTGVLVRRGVGSCPYLGTISSSETNQ